MSGMIKLHNTVYRQGSAGAVPMILVHAFPVDHHMWDSCAPLIAQYGDEAGLEPFSIWAPDMPGAGVGPIPDASQTGRVSRDGAYADALDLLADTYVDLVRSQDLQQAFWVGLSMGGYVVLDIQRRHPHTVAGIALCDTKADADSPQSRARRLHIAEVCEQEHTVEPVMHFATAQPGDSTIKQSPEFVTLFTRWIHDQRPEGIAWRQRMAAGRPDLNDQLPMITAPTALVSGKNDPSSPPAHMQPMAQSIVNADVSFTAIENCGHFSAVEHPDTVARALVDLMVGVNQQSDSSGSEHPGDEMGDDE